MTIQCIPTPFLLLMVSWAVGLAMLRRHWRG
jgi:hypothetical protein